MEDTPLLDDYILRACKKANPRVCFVPTASGDDPDYIARFYERFAAPVCQATDVQLVRQRVSQLVEFAVAQDIIYVGGGNTAYMLEVWRARGFDIALKAALLSGTVLAGLSAGSVCWFQQGVTDSFGPIFQPLNGLGFLAGSNCPHYDSEAERRPAYHRLLKAGMPSGYATDDGVALHFLDGVLRHVVSSRPNAKGYELKLMGNAAVETPLIPTFLGSVSNNM